MHPDKVIEKMAFAKTFQNKTDIISLANEITQAIEVTFSHTSSKVDRDNAYKVLTYFLLFLYA